MLLNITLSILISLLGGNLRLENKASKYLSKYYDTTVTIVDTGRDNLDGRLYYITNTSDKVFIGYARSKFETFDYMVLLDESNTIKLVKILIYREDYGGEVGSKRWLKQWIGVRDRKDMVHAISGATISVNSLKYSINYLLKQLKKN